jgi:hypothetical protein
MISGVHSMRCPVTQRQLVISGDYVADLVLAWCRELCWGLDWVIGDCSFVAYACGGPNCATLVGIGHAIVTLADCGYSLSTTSSWYCADHVTGL